jgi:alpha-glucosidase
VLPSAIWYDYWTGEKIAPPPGQDVKSKSASVVIQPKLDALPVFVREGAIIPMQPLVQSTSEVPKGPLTLRVYPGQGCHGSLYQDDGTNFAYERGEFLKMEFSCVNEKEGLTLHVGRHVGSYPAWWNQLRVEIYGVEHPPRNVTLLPEATTIEKTYDRTHHVSFMLADDGKGSDVRVEWAQ